MTTYTKAQKFATPEQREKLKKHYDVIEFVNRNHNLPSGNDATVQELNKIHKEIYGSEVPLGCGPCVAQMFTDLYIPREVLFHVEPEPVKTEPIKKGRKTILK